MEYTADDSVESWLDALPSRELFDHLRKTCDGGSVNMCTIRGNLFVWNGLNDSFCDGEVLTLNLNKLFASPNSNYFQVLKCTKVFGKACGLIPDESGVYLAVHFDKGLTVLQLSYDRGEHGEFGGGKRREVLCRNFSVAEPLFTRYDRLSLIQVSWYLPTSDNLALLTSDNFIRLFSLAEPDCPSLEIPLLSPYVHHSQRERLVIQDDCVIGFCLRNRSAFILHENGELSLVSLTQDTRLHVPQRMRMFPLSEDDDEIYSSSMLLLDTTPSLLVVAHKSGMIYHCIYLEASSEDGEVTEVSGTQKLYVMERVQIRSSEMDQLDDLDLVSVTLSCDPANPHGYFVTTMKGVYCVHIPCLGKLEAFATTTSNLPFLDGKEECQVTQLLHTELPSNSVLGISVVWETLLGYGLVCLTSGDWECITLSLKEPHDLRGADDYLLDGKADTLNLESSYAGRSSFIKTVENIIHPPGLAPPPILKSVAKEEGELKCQSDLFGFLMAKITETKQSSFIRQHDAVHVMTHKIQALKKLMEQVISNTVELSDEADIIVENSEKLHDKLGEIAETNVSLQKQAYRLACKIQFLSPVFSEAEECMKKEMEGLTKHVQEMKVSTVRAGEKSKLFQIMTVHPNIDLSDAQSTILLNQLTTNADKIKSLAAVVKILSDLTRTL